MVVAAVEGHDGLRQVRREEVRVLRGESTRREKGGGEKVKKTGVRAAGRRDNETHE